MARFGQSVFGTGVFGPDGPGGPPAPDTLVATAISATQANLSWADNATTETSYTVQRRTGAGAYATIATLSPNATTYSDTTAAAGTTYTYRVRATDPAGDSAWSNEASATTPSGSGVPAAPTGLTATAVSASQINLAWTDNAANETGYAVERSIDGVVFGPIATLAAGATAYSDTAVGGGTTYTYRVRATGASGNSAWSNSASATTPAGSLTAPAAPSGLTATVASAGLILLAWVDAATNEAGYTVQRRVGAGAYVTIRTLPAGAASTTDPTTTYATTYTYRVQAFNAAGASAWSNEATVTTPAAPAPVVLNRGIRVYVGPLRGQAPLPVVAEGADWTPTAGWEEVRQTIVSATRTWDGHQYVLRLDLGAVALDTATFADDRQIVVRCRWRDLAGVYTAWQVLFVGYCSGEASVSLAGSIFGLTQRGTVTGVQEWHYLERTQAPGATFGLVNLARGRPATASSTLTDLTAEAGLEYLTASSVGPSQAVDGLVDTPWVSNVLATATPPTLLTTGKKVIITEVFNGRGNSGTVGANGRSLWIELWCADVVYQADFATAGAVSGWTRIRGGATSWSNAWGGGAMLVTLPTRGDAVSRDFGGLTPEVEVAVSFTLRSAGAAPAVIDVGIAGEGATVWRKFTAPTDTAGARSTVRVPANRHGVVNVRFASTADGQTIYVDDLRVSGGILLAEQGQPYKRLWLVWESGTGGSGYADIANYLDGMLAIGGDRWVILVDDADLFRRQYDPGEEATVIPFRSLTQLAGLDFASGRGRLRLAYYRRWPDLPGDGGVVWDDLQFSGLPAFSATQSLVRTQVSPATWQARSNPAPGGAEATGSSWLNVAVGAYSPQTLTAAVGTENPAIVQLTSTARLPAYGPAYIDDERVTIERLSATEIRVTRTSPVGHGVGAPVVPEVAGQKVTGSLVAAVGWRRRPGLPTPQSFDIIGSSLPSPGDPSVPDGAGGVWGAHQDWQPLATVRNFKGYAFLGIFSREGDLVVESWPPPGGFAQSWGRQLQHVRFVIHQMTPWSGKAQRAKLDEVFVYEADPGSGLGGGYSGTNAADLRGVVGHYLVQHGKLPVSQVQITRGSGDGIDWGSAYGQLTMAPATVAAALANIERAGRLRVLCLAGGAVVVRPDPYTTSAAFQSPAYTWTNVNWLALSGGRAPAHAVARVTVRAQNQGTGDVYVAAYPRTAMPLGEVVELGDLILGSQADVEVQAAREYRQRNSRWTFPFTTGGGRFFLPRPYTRHLVQVSGIDAGGVEPTGRNALVERDSVTWRMTEYGDEWRASVELKELAPWS